MVTSLLTCDGVGFDGIRFGAAASLSAQESEAAGDRMSQSI
jgi:hypothetical protein